MMMDTGTLRAYARRLMERNLAFYGQVMRVQRERRCLLCRWNQRGLERGWTQAPIAHTCEPSRSAIAWGLWLPLLCVSLA